MGQRARTGWMAAVGCAGAVLVASGCSSSSPLGSLFPSAYASTVSARSARMTITANVASKLVHSTASGSGAFDWAAKIGQLTLTTTVPGKASVAVTEILDGSDLYLKLPPSAGPALGGKPWLEIPLSQYQQSNTTNENPAQILSLLEARSSSVTKIGPATIDGVPTTHFRADIDPAKADAKATPAGKALLAQLPSLTGSSVIPVDVWIDRQGRLRQMQYSVTIQHAPAGSPAAASAQAQQVFPLTVNTTMDLSDYGAAVNVTPPPADQVSTRSLPSLTGGTAST